MPQIQQQVSLGRSVQVQAALGQIPRKRLFVQWEERDRVREAVRLQSLLQGGDACARIGAVSPAARVRAVVKVDALQPDDAASVGAQGEGPVQVHPEMAAALRILNRLCPGDAQQEGPPGTSPADAPLGTT